MPQPQSTLKYINNKKKTIYFSNLRIDLSWNKKYIGFC